jgi:dipeptidyl aminopeptidase/acylaminoacyl peptidase
MNHSSRRFVIILAFLLFTSRIGLPQGTLQDYQRAAKIGSTFGKLAFKTRVDPHWISESARFWYRNDTRQGKEFILVDAEKGTRGPAFDHARLAEALSQASGQSYAADKLPFDDIEFIEQDTAIRFRVGNVQWTCNLASFECKKTESPLGSRAENERDNRPYQRRRQKRIVLRSPDGKWEAFRQSYNLFVRPLTGSGTGQEGPRSAGTQMQLSHDGEMLYDYASSLPGPTEITAIEKAIAAQIDPGISGDWSPDSKKIMACRIDQRKSGWFHQVKSVPDRRLTAENAEAAERKSQLASSALSAGSAVNIPSGPAGPAPPDLSGRPTLYSFVYPLAGEPNVPVAEFHIFDIEKQTQVKVDTDPMPMLYYEYPPSVRWKKDSSSFTFIQRERGYKVARLRETDAATGKTRTIIEERCETGVDPLTSYVHYLEDTNEGPPLRGNQIIWSSERDGWCHLYLYDWKTGELKNQITKGDWVVRGIERVDEQTRQIYFFASGREAGRDPYLRHLYKINLDGTGLVLLTPGHGEHSVTFSPCGRYIVDTYSRVDFAPVTELRRASDGQLICELEKADIELLLAEGWKWPQPFQAKARDDKTDIYGVLFRPMNFDPSKKYPIVECIYSGPQSFSTPKAFRPYYNAQSVAELGFLVIMVDGLGMGGRSKAFHDYSYKNLGDGGLPDHIAAMRQLAEKYPYMDLSRVGVYGGSAGGYDAAHALLTHPEFYKVAVATSGNHDHRLDKAWWVELWMGYPIGDHYIEQSNITLANKLKGKLLLLHGDMDQNVHFCSTMSFADALIKANKDFDMLIVPNGQHGLAGDYFDRKRWDYFVKHLLGVEPPDWNSMESQKATEDTEFTEIRK